MINRSQTTKSLPLNICGSSTFGRYPKISLEKSLNIFMSDNWMVDYAGYEKAIDSSLFGSALRGRAVYASTKTNRIVTVLDDRVYLVNISFNQRTRTPIYDAPVLIGTLQTSTGVVYVSENNRPQIVISDNKFIYFYDPTLTPAFQIATSDGTNPINFIPGFIDFHDTYILCAASSDQFYSPAANNTWRLGTIGDGNKLVFPEDSASIGFLQTKPDNVKAVVRFPSRGNMVIVMGETVSEPWYDVGYRLFPYQRSTAFNIDYGCINPATIAATDEIVAWLAKNEKSGPVIMYSKGGAPEKITTDGIDYFFSNMQNPADSRAFIYRQDGHLFYHINFYTDNVSLFYDFNTDKFYHACDEHGNYFIAESVAFFNNQYYFVTRNDGNLYSFDTIFTTFDGAKIPRIRICKSIKLPSQEYFIGNDVGFTIESGETPYEEEDTGPVFINTEDSLQLITEGGDIFALTEVSDFVEFEDDSGLLIYQHQDPDDFKYLIFEQGNLQYITPRVDLSISIDGGQSFSSFYGIDLPPLGQRRNKLQWWQLGAANDMVCMFEFWSLGRFVATDGLLNIRQ